MAPRRTGRAKPVAEGLSRLVSDTGDVVTRLLNENRTLKAQNKRLESELQRVSRALDEVLRGVVRRGQSRGR
jgi:hypothetical protein